jgi:(p)ppGpp synthase/HD superfamily hydrolase
MKMIFPAVEFATKAHAGQYRKGTKIPYIIHPLSVAKILIEHDCSEGVVIAGILHDTVEDTSITIEDIRRTFGEKVASLVEGASEPDKSDTWENRKRHTIDYLKTAPLDILLVSLADKLDNIRAIREDCEKLGESVWSRFNRPKESQAWYYRNLAEVFSGRQLANHFASLASDFQFEVNKIFAKR